jgi:UDP-N-acetylmuramyl tripeptide synthase
VILDREDAIHAAINENTDSIILIAWRGNETECEWWDKKIPMEDRKFILSCKK